MRSDCRSYFLTHYHSDHTTGLTPNFTAGHIYCSEVTRLLLVHDMGLPEDRISALPLNTPTCVEGVEVTPLCANHCPGAVMLHFFEPKNSLSSSSASSSSKGREGVRVLHVGDFRAEKCVVDNPTLASLGRDCGGLDTLYLDTTYCNPRHDFPAQSQVGIALNSLYGFVVTRLLNSACWTSRASLKRN